MWDDVIIGTGNKGNSAVRVHQLKSVSESSTAFWISDRVLGCGMTIFKNTKEGRELQSFLDNPTEEVEINDWLDGVLLRRIDSDVLKVKLKEALDDAFVLGRKSKAAELRAALGVD